jgi:lysophospholipase L1-like esterase
MKSILCYGDSLTWGMDAATGRRHAHDDLWPTVLGRSLGSDVAVVNAGLNGRTTMFDDYSAAADRNGARILPTMLGMHEPLDLVIIMLGSNDLKTFVCGSAVGIAQGVRRLLEIIRTFPYVGGSAVAPQVLVVSPPEPLLLGPSAGAPLLSPRSEEWKDLAPLFARVAKENGATFFDSATVATAEGGGDGIHLDAVNTRAIGIALAPISARMLGLDHAAAA